MTGRQLTRTQVPPAVTFERSYPGVAAQVHIMRADLELVCFGCPVANDVLLLASELATNAILHSRSGHPDRDFTVRATLYPGEYLWVEIIDQGGSWTTDDYEDGHGRGLLIVAAIAGDDNWGIEGNEACRVAWFRLNWHPA
jgi:serine/threonine-protein kinase RsbW